MKTERRHELQTNWLADRLGEAAQGAEPYAKGVLGVLIAVAVLVGTYFFLRNRAASNNAAGWATVWQAVSIPGEDADSSLHSVADGSSGQSAAWAQLILADNDLTMGVNMIIAERSSAMNHLDSALKEYQAVAQTATDPLARQAALYGIARTQESRNKLDEAREAYQKLIADFPDGPYKVRAQGRIDALAQDSTKTWYDWLQTAARPAPVSSAPSEDSVLPGNSPAGADHGSSGLKDLLEGGSSKSTGAAHKPPPEPKPDEGPAKSKVKAPGAGSSAAKATAPEATGPAAKKSGAAKPDNGKTDAHKPAAGKGDAGKAGSGKTDTSGGK